MGKYLESNQEPSKPQLDVLPIELYLPYSLLEEWFEHSQMNTKNSWPTLISQFQIYPIRKVHI